MNQQDALSHNLTEASVLEDLQHQPHLLIQLAENALTVAESLRNNYFKNTAKFVGDLRQAINRAERDNHLEPVLNISTAEDIGWSSVKGEVVTFIDGGLGQVQISSQVPILLRVGSYCVRTGEYRLVEREQFGYYPIILGDLEGGSKERKDFPDIVRITAELLGGLSALERTSDLRVLMFHGPLVYLMNAYAGHTPFTEKDIDLFLTQYAQDSGLAHHLKEDFLHDAKLDIYPKMTPERSDEWSQRHLFEPLAWIAFLYRKLINEALKRTPKPIIAGVVERSAMREFSQRVLLERIFRHLRNVGNESYFNRLFGRTDLKSPKAVLDRLGYTDTLLLAMLLHPGQYSESWQIDKYGELNKGYIALPGESYKSDVNWAALRPPAQIGFPQVRGCYVHVSQTTEPLRVEVFDALGSDQMIEAARRTYLYARLLPGYGFPVGLDAVDKYAHVPDWLTNAYSKLIRFHLGVSLQRGEISDAEMRRILVQAIYMTKRDWLFRPNS